MIFLGGTVGNNPWRAGFVAELFQRGLKYRDDLFFNPVVKDWNAEAQANEERVKKAPNTTFLFYLTDTMQEGNPISAYSLVEATMALYDQPFRTVVVFDFDNLDDHPLKAMKQSMRVLKERFPAGRIAGREEAILWILREEGREFGEGR